MDPPCVRSAVSVSPCRTAARAFLFLLVGFVLIAPAYPQAPTAVELRGRVTTPTGAPIAEAEISLLGTSTSVFSDSAGQFVLRGLAPGSHLVRVRRIGFKAQYLVATLSKRDPKDVSIVLERGAYELPEIAVTVRSAKPIEYAWTTRYDDFFRRKYVGLGRYLSRADIEKKAASRTASLLLGVGRVRFGVLGVSPTDVWFQGCKGNISVWLDGAKLRPQPREPAQVGDLLDRVLPIEIEMMEVYRSPAEMPAEFLDDSCGAIVIWTR